MSNNYGKVFQDQTEMNVIFVHSKLDDAGLSVYAFRVYCHIARRANGSGSAFPGMKTMSDICGCSESAVKRAVRELEDRGMLEVRRSTGGVQSNVYIITTPSRWAPGSGGTRSAQDPHRVLTEPTPGSDRATKVIQEGNPNKEGELFQKPATPTPIYPEDKIKIMELCCEIFKRKTTTKWSDIELTSLKKAFEVFEAEDLDKIRYLYLESDHERKYLRQDIKTLLNNWRGECDKAVNYIPE